MGFGGKIQPDTHTIYYSAVKRWDETNVTLAFIAGAVFVTAISSIVIAVCAMAYVFGS